jgi:hypothetical protein
VVAKPRTLATGQSTPSHEKNGHRSNSPAKFSLRHFPTPSLAVDHATAASCAQWPPTAIASERPNAGLHLRLSIWVVATTLFVAVNEIEPNPRLALALKFLIVFVSLAAVAGRLMRSSADGLSALMP